MKSKLSNCEANRTKIAEIRPIHRDNRSLQNDADLKEFFYDISIIADYIWTIFDFHCPDIPTNNIYNIILAQTPENRVKPRTFSKLWSA